MAWTLQVVEQTGTNPDAARFPLRDNQRTFVSVPDSDGRGLQLSDALNERNRALAHITVAGWGVKLQALQHIVVEPALPRSNALAVPSREQYHVNFSSSRPEVIFLRPDDKISFPDLTNSASITLVLKYDDSEVQVNSSVTRDAVPESMDVHSSKKSEQNEVEESTDDDDLDRDITAPAATRRRRSWATPNPSLSPSEIVQETPAANRVYPVNGFPAHRPALERDNTIAETVGEGSGDERATPNAAAPNGTATTNDTVNPSKGAASEEIDVVTTGVMSVIEDSETPSPPENEPETDTVLQAQSNLAARKSPTIRIPKTYGGRKRRIEVVDAPSEEEAESVPAPVPTPARPAKKARKSAMEEDKEDSPPSAGGSTSAKLKGRFSAARQALFDAVSAYPTNKGRLMPEATERLKNYWAKHPPKVAFSNSTVSDKKHLLRFVKTNGGTIVDTIKPSTCNILCVREGALRKSPKLLTAIALGIPVVTDEWLIASARAGKFLPPKDFLPQVVKQELEVGFFLIEVWGVPQSNVMKNLKLYFTPALRKLYTEWAEVEVLCRAAGAESIVAMKSANSIIKEFGDKGPGRDTVFLGLEEDDLDAKALMEKGYKVFNRDFLPTCILRGEVDLENDVFRIKEVRSSQEGKGKGRGRKSTKA